MSVMHGIQANLLPSALTPMANINAGLPVVLGAMPLHLATTPATAGVPVVCYSMADVKTHLGYSSDWATWPGCEAAYVFFTLYNVGPLVFINPWNPTGAASTAINLTSLQTQLVNGNGSITLSQANLLLSTLTLTDSITESVLVAGTDYMAAYNSDGHIVISNLDITLTDAIVGTVHQFTAPLLTEMQIIAAIAAIDQVFPRLRMIPGQLLAPGWSHLPAVAAPLYAKSHAINNLFQAEVIADVPSSVSTYGAVAAWIGTNNYTDANLINCWPKVTLGGQCYHLSVHLAALNCLLDSQHNDIPYLSPSNKALSIDGANLADDVSLASGASVFLGPETFTASLVPFVTAVNMLQWTCWGNYTGANAVSTDPDTFIPNIRMLHWIAKKLVLTFWPIVDGPINTRLVDTVINSSNQWLNSLQALKAIPGGKVAFNPALNSASNLAAGKLVISVAVGPDSPAQQITFNIQLDASFYSALSA